MASPKGETNQEQDVQHLFRAIRKGKAHLTRFMLAASNNSLLNCCNKEGRTPLIECCYIRVSGSQPGERVVDAVKMLRHNIVSVWERVMSEEGWEPLPQPINKKQFIEETTREHMVRILKEAGADVNMRDRNGKTALIHACEQRCNDIVRILIQHANICPDAEDMDGNTALIHSANIGNETALELLLKNFRRLGLNVDHYNKAGLTALHVATTNGFMQCAKLLAIKGKACLTLKDKVNQLTPLEWCLKEGYQKAEVEFLKPSVKFYRVAKLTTTMVKYRKKSTQESFSNSQDSPEAPPPPPLAIEKSKSKVKNLLRRSKTRSTEDANLNSGVLTTQKFSDGKSNVRSTVLEKSKSSFLIRTGQRGLFGKSSRQRSFSQSDQQEEAEAATKIKAGLTHSRSHPMTSKYLEASAAAQCSDITEASEGIESQGYLTLPDEYGECDTDDFEVDNSDLAFLASDINRNTAQCYGDGRLSLGEAPTSSSDTQAEPDGKPRYGDDGMYSPSSPYKGDDPSIYSDNARHSSGNKVHPVVRNFFSGGTPDCESETSFCTESTPSSVISVIDEQYLTSDNNEDESSCSSTEETAKDLTDMRLVYKTDKPYAVPQISHDERPQQSVNQEIGAASLLHSIPKSGRDSASPDTEAEYSDAKINSETTQAVKASSASTSKITETHATSHAAADQKSNIKSKNLIRSKRILQSPPTAGDTSSPQTESEDLDYDSPPSTSHQSADLQIFKHSSNPEGVNPRLVFKEQRQLTSPQTEIEWLERENDNKLQDNNRQAGPEVKTTHKFTRAQSECTFERRLIRNPGRDSMSPLTEIDFLDLRTPETDSEPRKSERGVDSEDKSEEDVDNMSTLHSTVKMSIKCLSDNVMRLVDQATSQGFVVESRLDKDVQQVRMEKGDAGSVCSRSESGLSSEADTVIVSLDNEISSSRDVSPGTDLNAETKSGAQEDAETQHGNVISDNEILDGFPICNEDAKSGNIEHIVNSTEFSKSYRVK